MKIYIFGGSFDPPHRGHFEIMNKCKENCDLFLLVPSSISPLKNHFPVADVHHRLKMVNLLAEHSEMEVQVIDWELKKGGMSYTYKTLIYLKSLFPKDELYLVLGADQLDQFFQWKNSDRIIQSVKLIIFYREGFGNNFSTEIPCSWITDFCMDISSTEIRDKIRSQKFPSELLIPEIATYIRQQQLYGFN